MVLFSYRTLQAISYQCESHCFLVVVVVLVFGGTLGRYRLISRKTALTNNSKDTSTVELWEKKNQEIALLLSPHVNSTELLT